MKRSLHAALALLLLFSLAIPAAAFAQKGGNHGGGQVSHAPKTHSAGNSAVHGRGASKHQASATTASHSPKARSVHGAKGAAKAAAAKTHGPKRAVVTASAAAQAPAAAPTSASGTETAPLEGTTAESTPASPTAHPGISNAFSHITANLDRMLAMVASGHKKQLPPGLVSVWLKFASWLGVDPSQLPGTPPAVTPGGSTDTSGSVGPGGSTDTSGSVAPSGTPDPTTTTSSTVDTNSTTTP